MGEKLKIEYVSIDSIMPYAKNAKLHPQQQIEQIKRSIKDYGMNDPIGVWHDEIVEGHGRLMACKELGITEVPIIRLEHMSDEQRKQYMLVHNQTTMNSDFDLDILSEELDSLLDFDAEFYDFDIDLDVDDGGEEVRDDEYDFKETVEHRAQTGDIFVLGEHRLMCGDCSDRVDVEKLVGGVRANMVFTDPPYGVAIGDKNKMLNGVQKAGRQLQNIEGDTLKTDELYDMLVKAFTNIREHSKEDCSYYVTSPQGGEIGLMMMMMMKDAGLMVRHNLIWEKNTATFSMRRLDYDYQHEPIFYTWTKKHNYYGKGQYKTTIWKFDKPRKCDLHPTMKPIELVAECLLNSSLQGDVVFDFFGGSGTTIIACEELGRKCYMMEKDPKFADVIIDRWENYTGEKAVLLK